MNIRTKLHIEESGLIRNVDLASDGVIIGSSDECEVKLSGQGVEKKHARLFLDPFGRWIIETIQNNADVCVNDKPIKAFSVREGDRIGVGPFTMRIFRDMKESIIPLVDPKADAVVCDDERSQTLTDETNSCPELSPARLDNLDRITNSLANLTNPKELYPEACKHLGSTYNDTIALVIKIPKAPAPIGESLAIIAQNFNNKDIYTSDGKQKKRDESLLNIHLSKTVLEAVRQKKAAFSATSESEESSERLTLVDDCAPRVVLAAPIAETHSGIDVLYVDQPALLDPSDALGFFAIVARMVNLARQTLLTAEYKAERKVIDHQLVTAKKIQSNLTPKKLDLLDNVELALHYKPALWVGGDYCDLCVSLDGRLFFAVGDVSGKGLPAAMVMANLQAMLKSILLFNSNPKKIMTKINEMLCDTLLDGMFITLVVGFLDSISGELEYVNAGHELPLLVSNTGQVKQLGEPANLPLGIVKSEYVVQCHTLLPNDGLLVVSDGITETQCFDSQLFGVERLLEIVSKSSQYSCQQIVDSVVDATSKFRGNLPQSDDSTILSLKFKA